MYRIVEKYILWIVVVAMLFMAFSHTKGVKEAIDARIVQALP